MAFHDDFSFSTKMSHSFAVSFLVINFWVKIVSKSVLERVLEKNFNHYLCNVILVTLEMTHFTFKHTNRFTERGWRDLMTSNSYFQSWRGEKSPERKSLSLSSSEKWEQEIISLVWFSSIFLAGEWRQIAGMKGWRSRRGGRKENDWEKQATL